MRTRRNVTSIALLLAFLGWATLVAGMRSPSQVLAQGAADPAAVAAQGVARAQPSEIASIISVAISAQPAAVERIVQRSVAARAVMAELIVRSAIQEQPTAASRITGAAIRGLQEAAPSQPALAQAVAGSLESSGDFFGPSPFLPGVPFPLAGIFSCHQLNRAVCTCALVLTFAPPLGPRYGPSVDFPGTCPSPFL